MHPEHTLKWLDTTADERVQQLFPQIQAAREAHRYQEASRLCLNFIDQADERSEHQELGLIYCQLGEVYRLQGVHHYREAADAFDKARVYFTLSSAPAGDRNKGIAYWSQAIVLEQMPGQWPTALRHYQAGLDCIAHELKRTQASSSLPRSKRNQLLKDLTEINQLLKDDYDRLLEQQLLGDPKIVGLTHKLAAAEERLAQAETRLKELAGQNADMLTQIQAMVQKMTIAAEKAEEASLVATKATEQAYFAARAAGSASDAADSASRKATLAVNQIQAIGQQIDARAQQFLAAAERIESSVRSAQAASSPPAKPEQG